MTETRYVIVLEVDNKRAAAAYAKGVAELKDAFPRLLESAKAYDAWCKENDERSEAEHKAKYGSSWFRSFGYSSGCAMHLLQTQANLENKLKVSSAAVSPFRMEEEEVLRMIACEDGSLVRNLFASAEARDLHCKKAQGC